MTRRRPATIHVGDGVHVPYPTPVSDVVSACMRANKSRDTSPELVVRSLLHRSGLRFRVDRRLRVGDVFVRPDIVFVGVRVAVFIDGCFWHRCPRHGTSPKSNQAYWQPKLDRNVMRDRRATEALRGDGWIVIRGWEHEPPAAVAARAASAVRRRRARAAVTSARAAATRRSAPLRRRV